MKTFERFILESDASRKAFDSVPSEKLVGPKIVGPKIVGPKIVGPKKDSRLNKLIVGPSGQVGTNDEMPGVSNTQRKPVGDLDVTPKPKIKYNMPIINRRPSQTTLV